MQAAIAPARRGQQPDTSACDVSSACKTWVTFKGDLDVRAKSGKSGQPVARMLDVAAPNLVTSLCCCPPRWCWSAGCMRALPAGGAHACRSRRRCYQRLVVVEPASSNKRSASEALTRPEVEACAVACAWPPADLKHADPLVMCARELRGSLPEIRPYRRISHVKRHAVQITARDGGNSGSSPPIADYARRLR